MTSWTPGPVPASSSPAPVREVFTVTSPSGRVIGLTDDFDTAAAFFVDGYLVS